MGRKSWKVILGNKVIVYGVNYLQTLSYSPICSYISFLILSRETFDVN